MALQTKGDYTESNGKVINDFHRDRLCQLMKDHGGACVIGNASAHEDGKLTPCVVLNPSMESPLMQDETFGPILAIIPTKNIDEAIKIITSKDKPLAVYYFGTNSDRNKSLLRVKEETSSGAFVVNDISWQIFSSELPFGGVGNSGYGRLHGKSGFDGCSNTKSILRKECLKFYPYSVAFPPYTKDKQRVVRMLCTTLDIS